MTSAQSAATRLLPWLSDEMDVLVDALVNGGALGLVSIDACALAEIEQRYGAQLLQTSLNVLIQSVKPAIDQTLGKGYHMLGQCLEPERVLIFIARPRSDHAFYTQVLKRFADHLREHVSVAAQRIAYPYMTEIFDVPVGAAMLLHRPFHRPEAEIGRLIDAGLAAGRFAAEKLCRERGDLVERLILEEGLSTVYEPIVALADNTRLGFEALTRGPSGTPLESPMAVFNVAHRCGLEYELDCVCRRLALQNAQGLASHEHLFLNILPISIRDPDFAESRVRATLGELAISPQQIVFEISERQTIGNYARFREAIGHLTGLGFRIAVDDVGAGYANLEAAIELSPDFLKVDRTLVHLIDADPQKQELLRGLVRLAEKMNAKVIAEGVETELERGVLQELGVSYGQGYAIGRHTPRPTHWRDASRAP